MTYTRPVLPQKVIAALFKHLYLFYGAEWGAKWADASSSEVAQAWAVGLGDLRDWQIAFALEHLPKYPPSLPVFREIAEEAPRPDRFVSLPPPRRATYGQRARVQAYMARIWGAMGLPAKADEAKAKCAELVELARDAGEETLTASELIERAEREGEQARAERIDGIMRGLRDGDGYQYNLRALLERQGTPQEQRYDWARIIAARVERGAKVSEFARRKAAQTLALTTDKPAEIVLRERSTSLVAPICPFPMNETAQEAKKRRAQCPQNPSPQDIIRYGMPIGGAA